MKLWTKKIRDTIDFRKSLYMDAIEGKKKPARMPLTCNDRTGKIFDMGYKLSDCLYDYEKMDDCVYGYHEKYEFDTYYDLGMRNPIKALDNFDVKLYDIDDEKGILQFIDKTYMEDPEKGYREIIRKGWNKYTYEDIYPLKYNFKNHDDALTRMTAFAKEYNTFASHGVKRQKVYTEKYGVPQLYRYGHAPIPTGAIFNSGIRGIYALSIDMRRHPDLLDEALESMEEEFFKGFLQMIANYKESENTVYAFSFPLLEHTIMNPKQFERYYWKYAKKRLDIMAENNMKVYIHAEGTLKYFLDYFRELPPNFASIMIEQDDPKMIKKALPNLTLSGGFPCVLLGHGTKQQCLDKAKEFVDELAYDGRYIYTTDKMISYKNDVKSENQLAVLNFLKEYAVYN